MSKEPTQHRRTPPGRQHWRWVTGSTVFCFLNVGQFVFHGAAFFSRSTAGGHEEEEGRLSQRGASFDFFGHVICCNATLVA